MCPSIDLTPQSTQIVNAISGLAGGVAQGVEAGAQISAQRARQAILAQAEALRMQAMREDMQRASESYALDKQQRGAAADAIGILGQQEGLPPNLLGVMQRMKPEHALQLFQETHADMQRKSLIGQIDMNTQMGAFADVDPATGEAKPNKERETAAQAIKAELEAGGDPRVAAEKLAQLKGPIIGERAQANIITGHVERATQRVAAQTQAGVDTTEAHHLLESAKIDPSEFEDKNWRMRFEDALRGYATASNGRLVAPTELQAYEKEIAERDQLKQTLAELVQRSQIAYNEARARAIENPALHRTAGTTPRTTEMSPSPEALYQQSQKSAAENFGSKWAEMTPEQQHAETLKQMGRIRSAKAGFAAMDENAQAQGGEPTPEQQGASQALDKTRLASPELRLADYKAHPEKYGWIGGDPAKLKAWVEQGKQ